MNPQLSKRSVTTPILAGLVVICGCAPTDDHEALTSWRGDDVHFIANGNIGGDSLEIEHTEGDALESSRLWCEREYIVPLDADGSRDYVSGYLDEFKLGGIFSIAGEERRLELEFKRHDFRLDAPGTTIKIVPRVENQTPANDEFWLEWEWHTVGGESAKFFEQSAVTGHFEIQRFSGQPGDDGLVIPSGEGKIGGVVAATWSATETISLSFTVPCTITKIYELAQ